MKRLLMVAAITVAGALVATVVAVNVVIELLDRCERGESS